MKYGLIVSQSWNVGDYLQSLSTINYLPRVDVIVNRDTLTCSPSKLLPGEKIKVIFNGYYTYGPENWPPSSFFMPLFVSFHIALPYALRLLTRRTVKYLKKYRVGCRDIFTKNLLESKGISSYFSGCLTLTLKRQCLKKSEKPIAIGLDGGVKNFLPTSLRLEILFKDLFTPSINYFSKIPFPIKEGIKKYLPKKLWSVPLSYYDLRMAERIPVGIRLKKAQELVQIIASSRLVLTSRLHVALTSVAVGTPVFFVHPNLGDPRFSGLLDLMHHYDLASFRRAAPSIDWDDPPENPNPERVEELKRRLRETVEAFVRGDDDVALA